MILEYDFDNGWSVELDTDDYDETFVYDFLKEKFKDGTDREKVISYFKDLGYDIEAMISEYNNSHKEQYDCNNVDDIFSFADEDDEIRKSVEEYDDFEDWARDCLEDIAQEKFEDEYEEESEDEIIEDMKADEADHWYDMQGLDL